MDTDGIIIYGITATDMSNNITTIENANSVYVIDTTAP